MADRLFDDIPADATIAEIAPLPSDPNVRRVRVGTRVVARLRAAEIERLELTVGMVWTEQVAERVREAIAMERARKAAFSAIGRKALSRGELIERLQRKGHDAPIVAQVVEEMADDGWLDDAALAREVVTFHRVRKPIGESLLREKLRERKIDTAVIDEAVREAKAEADADEIEAAFALAKKRLAGMRSLSPAARARRIAGLLHRRGFDDETIDDVLVQLGLHDASA
jgi:SOS response regulatory protein OraA/RecX